MFNEILSITAGLLSLAHVHKGPPCIYSATFVPRSTNASVTITCSSGPNCSPWDGTEYTGVCILSGQTDCSPSPPSGVTTFSVTMTPQSQPCPIGYVQITCINEHNDDKTVTVPANTGSCTFWFVSSCDDFGCTVTPCFQCGSGGSGQ